MSRRHTHSAAPSTAVRAVGVALALIVLAMAALPLGVAAQGTRIRDQDIEWEWQLLVQRNEDRQLASVPAGVGATLLLRAGSASGAGACSTYDSTYTKSQDNLTIFIQPEEITWRECDSSSREFDEAFYRNLGQVASIAPLERGDSVMTLNDAIGDPLMTLTRAFIDDDPSAARWDLARIGGADGSIEPVIAGLDPWMEFLPGGSVVGSTGCGSFLGSYTTNQNAIAIADVAHRFHACTEGARAQAERIIGTLSEITDFVVRPAGLTLSDIGGNARLALVPDIDFAQRIWTPVEVFDAGGQLLWPQSGNELSTSAVQFSGGNVEGRSICGPFQGTAVRSGLAITVADIAYTGAACRNPKSPNRVQVKDVEADFTEALEATSSHALRGSELELKDVDGRTRMRLLPQPALQGPTWVAAWLGNAQRGQVTGEPITLTFEEVGGVFQGDTGASNASGMNEYFGFYRIPGATRLVIESLTVDGRACRSERRKATPACKQEARYVNLLQNRVNGYVVRDETLWLLGGETSRPIIGFERQRAGGDG